MASLPPYSTYRTDAKQMMFPQATSHGNVLTFVPPGFNQELNVKFPDSRLAVCEKCKKNFKTRDMCRVRNTHTTAPWTTAYICITIDDSCLDEDGKYLDKPMTVRMVQWQPYCVKKPFDSKTPVCAACKRTNRTRSFCRERHKHRHLPWCTVYVLLSSLESADPTTVVAAPSTKVEDDDSDTNGEGAVGKTTTTAAAKGKSGDVDQDLKPKSSEDKIESETITSDAGDEGDDINDIPASRTFLVKVSCRSTSMHWLELDNFESPEASGFPGNVPPEGAHFLPPMAGVPPGIDPNHAPGQFYGQGMGFAAQQHQNALKSRQQYFFQMQQHHQQQYVPPQWQQHSPYSQVPVQGETGHAGATAGEAAAAQQRRGMEEMQPQQQWAMYYQGPPQGAYPPHLQQQHHEGGMHGAGMAPEGHADQYQPPPDHDDVDDQDAKRQRV